MIDVAEIIWEFIESQPDTTEFYNSYTEVKDDATYLGRYWEIPKEMRFTVRTILKLVHLTKDWLPQHPYSCLMFRCILFDLIKRYEKDDVELYIPHGWWIDAVFIDPRWLIKMTNGLLGWKGDLSCEMCNGGPDHDCPFYLDERGREELEFRTNYVVNSG